MKACHIGAERLPGWLYPVRNLEARPVKEAHLLTERFHLLVAENLRQEVVERLLRVENDPFVLLAIGEDLAVLEQHRRQERRVAGSAKPMDPLVDAVVILAEVHVGAIARALCDHGVSVVEDEQVHRIRRHRGADLAHFHDFPVIPVGIPGCGHDEWDGRLSHASMNASYACAA